MCGLHNEKKVSFYSELNEACVAQSHALICHVTYYEKQEWINRESS